jgi:ribose 5-phosphate isomerase B
MERIMKVAVGSDHAGFDLKSSAVAWLKEAGHEVVDLGPQSKDRVDYPDFAHRVAEVVTSGQAQLGVLVCGSGQGMAISANRHQGIRAALCTNEYLAFMARAHNDANVLCMGQRVIGEGLAQAILEKFLNTGFEGGRHEGRVAKIEKPQGE